MTDPETAGYLLHRAAIEHLRADATIDPVASDIHRRMANLYILRASETIPMAQHMPGSSPMPA